MEFEPEVFPYEILNNLADDLIAGNETNLDCFIDKCTPSI
tara:strand:- start:2790 stop:2909 length:120 start_codon:yes stop_codon:yes gene_type:complete